MERFYPEYVKKDPFAVMNWLYVRAKQYHDDQECHQISQYLDKLEVAYQESDEIENQYSDDGEMNYNSFDELFKRENYQWQKFNVKKKKARSSVKADSPKQTPTLTERKLSMKLKRKASCVIENKAYKDFDIAWT